MRRFRSFQAIHVLSRNSWNRAISNHVHLIVGSITSQEARFPTSQLSPVLLFCPSVSMYDLYIKRRSSVSSEEIVQIIIIVTVSRCLPVCLFLSRSLSVGLYLYVCLCLS